MVGRRIMSAAAATRIAEIGTVEAEFLAPFVAKLG
jgi:hypothetical protein